MQACLTIADNSVRASLLSIFGIHLQKAATVKSLLMFLWFLDQTLHGSSIGMKVWLNQRGFWHLRSQQETTTLFIGAISDIPAWVLLVL